MKTNSKTMHAGERPVKVKPTVIIHLGASKYTLTTIGKDGSRDSLDLNRMNGEKQRGIRYAMVHSFKEKRRHNAQLQAV